MPLFLPLLFGLVLVSRPALGETDPFPHMAAAYLVQVDGQTLWGKQPALRLPPASLTKLMTALLVLDQVQPAAEVVVSRAAAGETGTRLGLRERERFRARDLLAAALIASANDACRALMDKVAGQQRFVAMMNQRARLWGMADTHFSNGCGHDGPAHYSSARDLAVLAEKALAQPVIRELAARSELAIASIDGRQQHRLASTNALLGRCPGVIGLKTGHTRLAGNCLIAYAERGGRHVLLVMLNAPNRWWDAADIFTLAFGHGATAD